MRRQLILPLVIIVFSAFLLSCTEEIKECERKNTTDIEVVNFSGNPVIFKLWIEDVGFTEEQRIDNGASYIFHGISATKAQLWIDMGSHWYWTEEYTLTACEKFTFSWSG
ncbi:MAG TPA: hypothetical protein PKL52_01560 [Tenuifilaceae bacterium]|nr:hypothetical protein [Tenuifilaceae bacterium]